MTILDVMMKMFSFSSFFLLLFLPTCHLFVLLDSPNLVQYHGDRSGQKSYYTTFNSNSTAALIDYMRTLYEQEKDKEKQIDYNLIRALAPRFVEIDNVTMYVFDLNVIRRTESITGVSLHFYKRRTRWSISYSLNEIYSAHRLSSLTAQIQLESNVVGWQSFPLTDVIQRQLNYLTVTQRSEYFGLTLKPTVITKHQRRNIIELDKFSVYTPFLIIYSNDSNVSQMFDEFLPKNFEQDIKTYEKFENEVHQHNRIRREIDEQQLNLLSTNWTDLNSNMDIESCSVKPLVIDFADIGFTSWIIEPKNFLANRCSGGCQMKSMTNHALLEYFLQRIGIRNDLNLSPSTCVPERYSSLMIFYKSTDYHYLIRRLPNMIVDACHCR